LTRRRCEALLVTAFRRPYGPIDESALIHSSASCKVSCRRIFGSSQCAELVPAPILVADPNLRCGQGGTALGTAGPWPEVVDVLLKAGAIPKATR
jgi:hypothetical protein